MCDDKPTNGIIGEKLLASYYAGVHNSSIEIYRAERFYISAFAILLAILSFSIDVNDKILSIFVTALAFIMGILFFYRMCDLFFRKRVWLKALTNIQNNMQNCVDTRIKECIEPYEIRSIYHDIYILRLFYLPFFLCTPLAILGYIFIGNKIDKKVYAIFYPVIVILLSLIIGEFIRSKIFTDNNISRSIKNEK